MRSCLESTSKNTSHPSSARYNGGRRNHRIPSRPQQPRIAHYVQQYAEQPTILVGTIAPRLADQLGLRHLPAPTLRIKDSDKPTINLSTHQGTITRHAADWDHPVELRAPTSCICCHYKAHLTNRTIRPNESHCTGVFLQTLLAESLCLTVSYATHGPSQPATATIQHAKWINPELQRRPLHKHPADIPYIILARKATHQYTGPSLHPALVSLIPLVHTQPQDGTPMLPATNANYRCGTLTPAVLEDSDALLLGKAPKALLGDVLRHIAWAAHDEPM